MSEQPRSHEALAAAAVEMESPVNTFGATAASALDVLNSYIHVFIAAFLVTLLVTPLVRRLAVSGGIIDRPGAPEGPRGTSRKAHPYPVAYLGGLAVLGGLLAAVAASYIFTDAAVAGFRPVPIAVVVGMIAIAVTGFADDVWGWDPRLKIAGQLVAAAALAYEEVGVLVAAGVLTPIFGAENLELVFATPLGALNLDIVYWVGTFLIAAFVLGGCNAANLIDGLDGLLSGAVAIIAIGLLLIGLLMLPISPEGQVEVASDSLAGARIVLALALLGAVLGFLPHNFNPASIFLGDCGSLLLGYMCVVVILMFGEYGQTHLVFAGLIVFSLPIIDTTLAIIRRWLAGIPMSSADDQHIHHQLHRALGGVKRTVIALYLVGACFAAIGVSLAGLVIHTEMRVRFIYVIALVLFGFIGVIAVKAARRKQWVLAAEPETTLGAGREPTAAAPVPPKPGVASKASTTSA